MSGDAGLQFAVGRLFLEIDMAARATLALVMVLGFVGCAGQGKNGVLEVPGRKADLTSDLKIEAGKEFLYGGGKDGSYLVSVENVREPGLVIVAMVGDARKEIARVANGQKAVHRFGDGETAVIVNTSTTKEARATVRVWGATDVGMRYEPAR